MGAIEHLTISLPVETVERMRDWVATGDLPDLNAVVAEALREFEAEDPFERDAATDEQLKKKVAKAYDGWRRDSTSALTLLQAMAEIKRGGRSNT